MYGRHWSARTPCRSGVFRKESYIDTVRPGCWVIERSSEGAVTLRSSLGAHVSHERATEENTQTTERQADRLKQELHLPV